MAPQCIRACATPKRANEEIPMNAGSLGWGCKNSGHRRRAGEFVVGERRVPKLSALAQAWGCCQSARFGARERLGCPGPAHGVCRLQERVAATGACADCRAHAEFELRSSV